TMNVNLSVKELTDPKLVERVESILKETGVQTGTLKLELTESSLIAEIQSARDTLAKLRSLHVGLKLDDFGTGYSSLSYLHNLNFDSLKIDRSFVSRLSIEPDTQAIIATILELARTLHMSVVAEGIETEDQMGRLLELGCEIGQGFLFSRPVPADEAERLLSIKAA